METKTPFSRLLALAMAGVCFHFTSHASASLSAQASDLTDCKRFAVSDQLLARFTEKHQNASEFQKDEYRKNAIVNVSILFACNDPQTAEWQRSAAAKEVCAEMPKLAPGDIALEPEPAELTDRPWRVCNRSLIPADTKTRIHEAFKAQCDQIDNPVVRIMKCESFAIDQEPTQDEICKTVMSSPKRAPKRPSVAAMALIERAYHLPDERLDMSPNESLETFRDLSFEPYKPTVKITDQADVPEAAILLLRKTGSCPVPGETGAVAIKCGANNLFWSPNERNKDLNQFLKDNSECIQAILARPSWNGASPGPATAQQPAAPAHQVK